MNASVPGTGLVAHPAFREHRPRPGHPECPERYDAAIEGAEAGIPPERLTRIQPYPADDEDILRCHTRAYLETAERDVAAGLPRLSTGDTDICLESLDIAFLAVGGVLAAVDAVAAGEVRNAFCPVRPPGHHATPAAGMGFCILNNVAIAARYAQRTHGLERVLIIDWDVHHGNGTQDTFFDDPSVFYFSTHQSPCFPGSGSLREMGTGKGTGATRNCPFPPGTEGEAVIAAFTQILVPAMAEFCPELVLISAGFDARENDPVGAMKLTDDDFATLTSIAMWIAAEHAQQRLVSVLEGGYNLDGLRSAVGAHTAVLAGVAEAVPDC